jgi:DNA-binding FadR family transcriptional regulator
MFEPIYRRQQANNSMHSQLLQALGLRIVSGEFKPGDKLPHETQLLALYDVSRPVLREVIRVLVAKGLLLSRQGLGSVVRHQIDWHLLDPDVLFWLIKTKPQKDYIENLTALRRIFEPEVAALAARCATKEALSLIELAYEGMASAETVEELLLPDLAFHRYIAQATNNEMIAYIANMLSFALSESIKLSSKLPNTHDLSLPRHKAILTAIQNKDSQAARMATLLLLDETIDDLNKVLDSEINLA